MEELSSTEEAQRAATAIVLREVLYCLGEQFL